jgi:hypothetical protein
LQFYEANFEYPNFLIFMKRDINQYFTIKEAGESQAYIRKKINFKYLQGFWRYFLDIFFGGPKNYGIFFGIPGNQKAFVPVLRGRWGDREAGRQGSREAGKQGDRETGNQGNRETGRQGDRETGKQGDRETRETGKQGDRETGRQGNRETGKQGRQKNRETGKQGFVTFYVAEVSQAQAGKRSRRRTNQKNAFKSLRDKTLVAQKTRA